MSKFLAYPNIEQAKSLQAFLEALDIPYEIEDEVLPPHVLEGIKRGQEDIEAGRFTTHEEFIKNSISKCQNR